MIFAYKVMNSKMRSIFGILKDALMRVGSWFGRMYLRVIMLEDYVMILGLDFMRTTQTFPLLEKDKIFIIRDHGAQIVPMVKKSSVDIIQWYSQLCCMR